MAIEEFTPRRAIYQFAEYIGDNADEVMEPVKNSVLSYEDNGNETFTVTFPNNGDTLVIRKGYLIGKPRDDGYSWRNGPIQTSTPGFYYYESREQVETPLEPVMETK